MGSSIELHVGEAGAARSGLGEAAKPARDASEAEAAAAVAGMLLHIDASKHAWFQDGRYYDLITIHGRRHQRDLLRAVGGRGGDADADAGDSRGDRNAGRLSAHCTAIAPATSFVTPKAGEQGRLRSSSRSWGGRCRSWESG